MRFPRLIVLAAASVALFLRPRRPQTPRSPTQTATASSMKLRRTAEATLLTLPSVPERLNGFDDNADTIADEPLPASGLAHDCDGDGYPGSVEAVVFARSDRDQVLCGNVGWPAELAASGSSYNKVDLLDITSFVVPVRYFGTNVGTNPGDVRWDLEPRNLGPGPDISLVDLTSLVTVKPPMFGQDRAFGGATCGPVDCLSGANCCNDIPSRGLRVCVGSDKLVYQSGEEVKLRLSVVNITAGHLIFYSNNSCWADFFVVGFWDSTGLACLDVITPVSLSPGEVRFSVQPWYQQDSSGQEVARGSYEIAANFSVADCVCYAPGATPYVIELVP